MCFQGSYPSPLSIHTSYGGLICPPAIIACATMRALARRGSVLVAVCCPGVLVAVCCPGVVAAAAAARGVWWCWKVKRLRPVVAGAAVVAGRAGEGVWSVALRFIGVTGTDPAVARGRGAGCCCCCCCCCLKRGLQCTEVHCCCCCCCWV